MLSNLHTTAHLLSWMTLKLVVLELTSELCTGVDPLLHGIYSTLMTYKLCKCQLVHMACTASVRRNLAWQRSIDGCLTSYLTRAVHDVTYVYSLQPMQPPVRQAWMLESPKQHFKCSWFLVGTYHTLQARRYPFNKEMHQLEGLYERLAIHVRNFGFSHNFKGWEIDLGDVL